METPTSVADIVTNYLLNSPGAAIFVGRSSLEYLSMFADLGIELYALGLATVDQPKFRSGRIVFSSDYEAPRWWNGAFPTVIAADLFAEELSAQRRLLLTQHLVELLSPIGKLVLSTFDFTPIAPGFGQPHKPGSSLNFGFHSLSLELRLLGLELETFYAEQHIGVFHRHHRPLGDHPTLRTSVPANQ